MRKNIFLLCVFLLVAIFIQAQEGMWLLTQIGQLDLSKKGLQLTVDEIYSKEKPALYNAIVQLGGGTASFVSQDGLLLTNHHVAFTALQRSSSANSDFITNGFLAKTRAEEIQAPGYRARLLTGMNDVTSEIVAAGAGISDPVERDKKINEKIQEMTDGIKKEKTDVQAVVSQMFNGRQYILFVYKVFKDVRIVYAPPLSIGNYGGETDNWMWPRHTGDFSFLRVYCAPDGTGREYNTENVPYKPKVWLKVAKSGLKEGDLTFVLGYPGFTTRYRSSTSVHWNQEYNYPFNIDNFREIIQLAEDITKNDPEGKIRVASLTKSLANAMKNYEGKVEGMKKTNFLDKKIAFEKEYIKWANSDPVRKEKFGNLLSREKEQYELIRKTKDRDNIFGLFQGLAGTQLNIAFQIYFIAEEMEKPEKERRPGFDKDAINEVVEGLPNQYSNYFQPFDIALLIRALNKAAALPPGQRIQGLDYILLNPSRTPEQFVKEAYENSKLNDQQYAASLFGKSVKELKALNDPFINLAASLYPLSEEVRKTGEIFSANVTDLRKQYLEALYEWKGTGLYPDANGTMRFTWGPVKGYRPRDAVWYVPFTALQGVIEKNTGNEPFNAPPALTELYMKKDFGRWKDDVLNDVPVAFLSQCDITGGNSGSPIMNTKGEISGVVFDGNYEAMISDWQYDYALQRTISVDIRYVLFVTEKFGKAEFILAEMGIK
jgi:hypothetical protein